jgi:hypothetical protein
MDYSKYKKLDFKRNFIAIPPKIQIVDPESNTLVGFIKMKLWSLRGDVRVYTDRTMQNELFRIGGRQAVSFNKVYNIFESASNTQIYSIRQKTIQSVYFRNHMDIFDSKGGECGYVQETSKKLAIFRRWIEVIPYIGPLIGLVLLFVPQTFDIMYDPNGSSPQVIGRVIHKKTPALLRMSLDTSMAQVKFDPRLTISAVSLLCILDASKNR